MLLLASASVGIQRVTVPAMTAKTVVSGAVTALDRVGTGWGYASGGKLFICNATLQSCQPTATGPSGTVLQILADPKDSGKLYALTSASLVHHSDDGGKSWSLLVKGQ